MQTTIQVNSEAVQRKLQQLAGTLDGPGRARLMKVLGTGLALDVQRHFLARNGRPNKRGWKKSGFWGELAEKTSMTAHDSHSATVTVADRRLNPHLHGGTIRPRTKKYLAIPAQEEAKGVKPSSGLIPGLFYVRNKKGTRFLATRHGAGGTLEVHYWLKPSVRIPRDPDALPPRNVLTQATLRRARAHIDRATG